MMKTEKLNISEKNGGLKNSGDSSELVIESEENSELTNISIRENTSWNERTVSEDLFPEKANRIDNSSSFDRQYVKKKKKKKQNYNSSDVESISEIHIESYDANTENLCDVVKKRKKHEDAGPRKNKKIKWLENTKSEEFLEDESFVSMNPQSLKSKKDPSEDLTEKRKKKKRVMPEHFSSAPLVDFTPDAGYPIQAVKKEESAENKAKKKKLDKCLNSQSEKSTSCSESNQNQPKKNSKLPSIPDSALDNLLLKFDKIVAEDEKKHEAIEAARNKRLYVKQEKKESSQDSSEDDNIEIARMDGSSKKRVIKLLKETKSMEKIKEELDMKTDYVQLQKLRKTKFEVPWPLPLIHKIAYHVSVTPTPKQREDLEHAGIKLKVGKYTKEEDEKIRQNWQLFCQYHDWDVDNYDPFLLGSEQSRYGYVPIKKFMKFVQFISHNFEDRLMYYIYLRFKRLYGQLERTNFTHEDDEIILEYLTTSNSKKPFADLAVLLKRSRVAVLKRYQKLINDRLFDTERITWDENLTKKLFLAMVEVTGVEKFSELRERRISAKEWKKISKKMGIPLDRIKRVWFMDLYTRVFNPTYEEDFERIRQELIETLYENYNDWREVDWKTLAKKFDSFTSPRLYKMFTDLMRSRVPKEELKDFKASLEYLKKGGSSTKPCKFAFVKDVLRELEEDENKK